MGPHLSRLPSRTPGRGAAAVVARAAFALAVAGCLVAGLAGGLVRADVALPASGAWLTHAVMSHAFLMVCAFMGTVIGIERAVALKGAWPFLAPLASAAGGVLVLLGRPESGAAAALAAACVFVAVNLRVVRLQDAPHTRLLLVSALAWAAGNLLHVLGAGAHAVVPWWFAFLVLTIAAERLEMTRLMRRRHAASPALHVVLGALLLGSALSAFDAAWGGVVYGASLCALAAWLLAFDIARRTVRAAGLSRYMAVCLLGGYAWLAVAGAAWAATALGLPGWRDTALHALGLGFVFSMMLGHAPVILPALARIKVQFGPAFYLPLLVLHASLAWRLFMAHAGSGHLATGAALNAAAIALFVLTMAGAVLAWRRRHASPIQPRDHDAAVEH